MNDARKSDQSQAPGHFANQGPKEQATPRSTPDREEQYQRTKDQAPTDTGKREDRIRQRRTRFGRPKADPKVTQIATEAVRQRILTVKTLPSTAKALLARSRASGRKEMLISCGIMANRREAP